MIIKFMVSQHRLGPANAEEELEIDISDDATPEEIDEEKEFVSREWAFNQISISHD